MSPFGSDSHSEDPVHRFPLSCPDKPHVVLATSRSAGSKLKRVEEAIPLRPASPGARPPRPPRLREACRRVRGAVGSPCPLAQPASGVKPVILPRPAGATPLPAGSHLRAPRWGRRRAVGTGPGLTWAALAAALAPGPARAAGSPRLAHLAPAPHSPARTAPAASPGAGRRRLCRSPAGQRGAGDSAPLLPPPHLRRVPPLRLSSSPPPASPPSGSAAAAPRPPPRRAALAKVRVRAPPGPLSHRPGPAPPREGASPRAPLGPDPACTPSLRAGRGAAGRPPRGPRRGALPAPHRARALYLRLEGQAARLARAVLRRSPALAPKSGPGRGSGGERGSERHSASRCLGTPLAALPAPSAHPRRDTDAHSPGTHSLPLALALGLHAFTPSVHAFTPSDYVPTPWKFLSFEHLSFQLRVIREAPRCATGVLAPDRDVVFEVTGKTQEKDR
ncbi:hypothetical protein AB1E18_010318 [Capra hircus]